MSSAEMSAPKCYEGEWKHSRRRALLYSERRVLLIGGDLLCIFLSALLGFWGWYGFSLDKDFSWSVFAEGRLFWVIVLVTAWFLLCVVNECYRRTITSDYRLTLRRFAATLLEVALVYLVIYWITQRPFAPDGAFASLKLWGFRLPPMPRIIPAVFMVTATFSLSIWRLIYVRVFTSPSWQQRVLVVGAGRTGSNFVREVRNAHKDYNILGLIDDDPAKRSQNIDGISVLGSSHELLSLVASSRIDEVVVATSKEIPKDLLRVLMDCRERGVSVKPIAVMYEELFGRVPVEDLSKRWFFAQFWKNGGGLVYYGVFKRALDIVCAFLLLVCSLPLIPFVAAAICLDNRGPILYSQRRVGLDGKVFRILKFRTMIPNAEENDEACWACQNDPRITRVGKFLRRTRLDEIPQFWNVLKGEMSLVGPRPERPEFVSKLQEEIPFYRARLSVKPGLTGWAQINYPYGNSTEDARLKMEYDLYYIKHQSFVVDLLVMFRTIKTIVLFQGT